MICYAIWIGHANNIPTIQFFIGISRNTLSKLYMLSLAEISKIMHCGILINMPYYLSKGKAVKGTGGRLMPCSVVTSAPSSYCKSVYVSNKCTKSTISLATIQPNIVCKHRATCL